jgi:hypothetical protein
MVALSFLSLAIIGMANATPPSSNTGTISLLDIVNSESATALKKMIDNSPSYTYIKPDLSDVNLLKVSVIDGNNESIVAYMEAATNSDAAVYQKAIYGDSEDKSKVEATDPASLDKRASRCGQYCSYRSQCTADARCPACYHQYGNTSHQKACTGQYGSVPIPTYDSG